MFPILQDLQKVLTPVNAYLLMTGALQRYLAFVALVAITTSREESALPAQHSVIIPLSPNVEAALVSSVTTGIALTVAKCPFLQDLLDLGNAAACQATLSIRF